jgi:signal transduction histidine kinase
MLGLNRLMHDLFELANLESANARFIWTNIAASSWLDEVWQKYVSDVNNAGFCLEQQNRISDAISVRVDKDRLDQVFANLISNAIRFMGSDGKIVVSCELATPERVLFKVADNGSGMDPADIPKVFDRLYRGSHSRGNSGEHSGLGLAIVKEIVEAHQGKIWVDDSVNIGCTLCILLPVVTADH